MILKLRRNLPDYRSLTFEKESHDYCRYYRTRYSLPAELLDH